MLSLISIVFPVCEMRLVSLNAEEGVTAGKRRGTAIRVFLKASVDTLPPAGAHTKAGQHTQINS